MLVLPEQYKSFETILKGKEKLKIFRKTDTGKTLFGRPKVDITGIIWLVFIAKTKQNNKKICFPAKKIQQNNEV